MFKYAVVLSIFLIVSIVNAECIPNWQCSDWVTTSYGKTRTCIDLNNCGFPIPTQDCVESWNCTAWSSCIDGQMTRTCIDNNDCGTEIYKPETAKTCTVYSEGEKEYFVSEQYVNENISVKIKVPNEIMKNEKFNVTATIETNIQTKNLILEINNQRKIFNITDSKTFYFEFIAPDEKEMTIETKLMKNNEIIFSEKISIPVIFVEETSKKEFDNEQRSNDYKFIFIFIIVIIILLMSLKARVAKSGQRR